MNTNISESLESPVSSFSPPKLLDSCSRKFDKKITILLLFIYASLELGNGAISISFLVDSLLNYPSNDTLKSISAVLASVLLIVPFLILLVHSEPKWYVSAMIFLYGIFSIFYTIFEPSTAQDVMMFLSTITYTLLYYGGILYLSFWFPSSKLYTRIILVFLVSYIFRCFNEIVDIADLDLDTGYEYTPILLIYNYVGASVVIIVSIVSIFLLKGYPENFKFLTEDEKKNAIEVLSAERGLISDVKGRALQIFKGFRNKNVYIKSLIYALMGISSIVLNNYYTQIILNEITNNEDVFNSTDYRLYYASLLSLSASYVFGAILLFFTKSIKRINVGLTIMFGFAILFSIVTVLISKLSKQYVAVFVAGLIMNIFNSAIQIHIFALLFAFTNNPSTRIFSMPAFLLSVSILNLIFGGIFRLAKSDVFNLVLGIMIMPITAAFTYYTQ
ncbi:hypothetical protein BB558_002288 [Smittium angustum]|uniref:Major facilitator superfamily (MFS) profile domain-containing protein n=1 Tax=Smittium angustum TaxID=133377 RepID=A0A2U1J9H4_SMIAN|nr:hypothetical protein BB558_002288 [Smittium angustum]